MALGIVTAVVVSLPYVSPRPPHTHECMGRDVGGERDARKARAKGMVRRAEAAHGLCQRSSGTLPVTTIACTTVSCRLCSTPTLDHRAVRSVFGAGPAASALHPSGLGWAGPPLGCRHNTDAANAGFWGFRVQGDERERHCTALQQPRPGPPAAAQRGGSWGSAAAPRCPCRSERPPRQRTWRGRDGGWGVGCRGAWYGAFRVVYASDFRHSGFRA